MLLLFTGSSSSSAGSVAHRHTLRKYDQVNRQTLPLAACMLLLFQIHYQIHLQNSGKYSTLQRPSVLHNKDPTIKIVKQLCFIPAVIHGGFSTIHVDQRKGRRCEERRGQWPKKGPGMEDHDPETDPTEIKQTRVARNMEKKRT